MFQNVNVSKTFWVPVVCSWHSRAGKNRGWRAFEVLPSLEGCRLSIAKYPDRTIRGWGRARRPEPRDSDGTRRRDPSTLRSRANCFAGHRTCHDVRNIRRRAPFWQYKKIARYDGDNGNIVWINVHQTWISSLLPDQIQAALLYSLYKKKTSQ